jgi:hypothetical protein
MVKTLQKVNAESFLWLFNKPNAKTSEFIRKRYNSVNFNTRGLTSGIKCRAVLAINVDNKKIIE